MTTIASIRKRQGIAPPITPAQHAEYERAKAERRAKNVVNAREILDRNGIKYFECAEVLGNENLHVAFEIPVKFTTHTIIYFPEIGRWHDLEHNVRFGCRNLVKHLKGECL